MPIPPSLATGRINRGISGQTSAQMLLRFQADVVALKPRVVHLLTGGNDIAGNAGLTSEQVVKDNVIAMVTLARANDIKVVLGSITPIERVWWAPDLRPGGQVKQFNAWLRDYARAQRASALSTITPRSPTARAICPPLTPMTRRIPIARAMR